MALGLCPNHRESLQITFVPGKSCCQPCLDRNKRYTQSDRFKTYRKAYKKRPEVKAKRAKYLKEYLKTYTKDRCARDPAFRLARTMRCRIWWALHWQSTSKTTKTAELLGCSAAELKTYIESLFLPGMTWDNYGVHGWHVDHKKPLSSFDLQDQAQLKLACHYTNLTPLWALDNLQKGSKT